MDKYYVTKERLEELKAEYENLKTRRRREVAERLKNAKEFGDLSENSEYTEAKEEQEQVERRIFELEDILKSAAIIKEGDPSEQVRMGSTVTVKVGDAIVVYRVVGSEETKPEEGKISNESPLGAVLLGKRVGDSAVVKMPSGEKSYKITKIE